MGDFCPNFLAPGRFCMQYTNLGRTALKVSRLALGTRNFGTFTPEDEACRILDSAFEAGVNILDTANSYGGRGATEEIIGRWLSGHPGRRDQVVLATKVYAPMGDGPNQSGLSALHIRSACEDSLRRLRTDYIDLYQMHHIARDAPWDEVWQAMEWLVQQGKILYVGSSNFAGWHIAEAMHTARERKFLGLVAEQSIYNLLRRTIELEVLPACQAYGVAVLPWSPLAAGLLTSSIVEGAERGRSNSAIEPLSEADISRLHDYRHLCAEIGQDPENVALAWLLSRPGVTAPIIGPRTVKQLETLLASLTIELPSSTLDALDNMFPGPGGAAPEAYAGF